MLAILSITFPIYAAIALGYVMVRQGVFQPQHMPVFGGYVLNVALPALLFNAVATRDVSDLFNLTYMAVFLAGSLATITVAFVILSAVGTSPTRRAVAIMGTSCANTGFVGYPLLLLALPSVAGQVLALNMLVENFVVIPVCLAIMEASKAEEAHILRKLRNILLGVLRRPMVLALTAGLVFSLSGLVLPEPAGRFLDMLAASSAALALFVIGGSLVGVPSRGNSGIAMLTVLGKLALHPAMIALTLLAVPMIGLAPLPPDLTAAAVISAAVPMFTIYALFAQELGHEGMASIAQVLATTLAFFTLSALLFVLL
ncbi:AEC family transporter [Marimonas arenosa]|uniref:AEC family transporter n=1 Tax=Marimonas arenosa TaxID=1795305 RepID=A0AAE3WC24_9RHOB|nr:AEC family transporter [Marimonas arenosa]MDQ2089879.1 AEC family transporter [Marimonas arenosa]